MRFVFAREKDGKVHFRKRHPNVAVREVKEVFHFRMAVQPTYGDALKGIGHTRSRRLLVVILNGARKRTTYCRYSLSGEKSTR